MLIHVTILVITIMAFIEFKKCLTDPKQLLKLVLLVICVCVTIYQLSQCVLKLIHPPVSTFYQFDFNETIVFPDITICRHAPYKTAVLEDYGFKSDTTLWSSQFITSFPFATKKFSHFLKELTFSFEENIYFISIMGEGFLPKDNFEKAFILSEYYLLNEGRCQTMKMQQPFKASVANTNSILYLRHDTKQKTPNLFSSTAEGRPGYRMYFHDPSESPTGVSNEQNNFIESLFIDTLEEVQIVIRIEMFNRISTSNQPCVNEVGYSRSQCEEKCVHNYLAKQEGCTAPWLKNLNESYPECTDAKNMQKIISGLQTSRTTWQRICTCLPSCNVTLFTPRIENRRELKGNIMSNVAFTYSTNILLTMTEVILYDFNTFISEIGGSLGFLLGLSVIGAILVIEEMLRFMFCNKKIKSNENSDNDDKGSLDQSTIDNASEITLKEESNNKNSNQLENFVEYLSYLDKNSIEKETEKY